MVLLPCSKCCGPCWRCYKSCGPLFVTDDFCGQGITVKHFPKIQVKLYEEFPQNFESNWQVDDIDSISMCLRMDDPESVQRALEAFMTPGQSYCKYVMPYNTKPSSSFGNYKLENSGTAIEVNALVRCYPNADTLDVNASGETRVSRFAASLLGRQCVDYDRLCGRFCSFERQFSSSRHFATRIPDSKNAEIVRRLSNKEEVEVPAVGSLRVKAECNCGDYGKIETRDVIELSGTVKLKMLCDETDDTIPDDYQCFPLPPTAEGWEPVGDCYATEEECAKECGPGKDCSQFIKNFCDGNDYNIKNQILWEWGGDWERSSYNLPWLGDGENLTGKFRLDDFLVAKVMPLSQLSQVQPGDTDAVWEYQSFDNLCSSTVWDYPYNLRQMVELNCGDSSRFEYQCTLEDMSIHGIDTQQYFVSKKDIQQSGPCDLSGCPDLLAIEPRQITFGIGGSNARLTDEQRHNLLSGKQIFLGGIENGLFAQCNLIFDISDECCADWSDYTVVYPLGIFYYKEGPGPILSMACDQKQEAAFFPLWPPSNRWMYNASEGLPNEFPDWAKNPVVSLDSLNDSTAFPKPIDDDNFGIVVNEPFKKTVTSEELYRYDFEYKAKQDVATSCITNIKINIANARTFGPIEQPPDNPFFLYVFDYSLLGLQYVDENKNCVDLPLDAGLVTFQQKDANEPPPSDFFVDYGPFKLKIHFTFSTEDVVYYTCSHTAPAPTCEWQLEESFDIDADCADSLPENDFRPIYEDRMTPMPTTKTTGPGTHLKNMLAAFGIKAKEKGCGCKSMEKKMNRLGNACTEPKNLQMIVDHLQAEAKKRHLPFVRKVGEMLVKRAVRKSQQNS